MERIQQLIGNARYKLAVDTDTNHRVNLESSINPLKNNFNKIISTINAEQIFTEERNNSKIYRFSGRLNVITDNSITITGSTGLITPTDEDWDPLFDGADINTGQQPVEPYNWVIQILYPSKIDKYDNVETFPAYRGIEVKNVSEVDPSGTKPQLMIETLQKHLLSIGEYCYTYSTTGVNGYTGFHQVEYLGENGENLNNKITLKSKYLSPTNRLLLKRVVNVSDDDVNFLNPKTIKSITVSDLSGNTTNADYIKVTTGDLSPALSASTHDLRVADYVDIRSTTGVFGLNGLHRVEYIVDRYNFVIDLKLGTVPGFVISNLNIPFRRLDGVPSDYYIRKFTVLSDNKYEVTKSTSFGTSIYPKTKTNKLGIANDTWLFSFIEDISTEGLYSHRNGNLTELYLATIKRSGENNFNWSNVTAHWDFQYSYADQNNFIETVSFNNPSSVGTIEKKYPKTDEYFGDFVEYNRLELLEKTSAKIIHRFTPYIQNTPLRGYYIDPFQKIYIRKFSNIVESVNNPSTTTGIPGDSELRPNGSIIWRDILEPGFIEESNNGVNYPFINGANYIYLNKHIFVRRQRPELAPIKLDITATPEQVC